MTEVAEADKNTVETPGQQPRSRGRSLWFFFRDILFILLAALVISFLIKTFLFRSFFIPSGSMENTLLVNDRVIVSLLTPELSPLHRGDVVVFFDPGGWLVSEPVSHVAPSPLNDILAFVGLAAPNENDHLIKRVIGLPGDHVKCCNALGKVTVNGVSLTEPYINVPAGGKSDPFTFDVTVPKGDIWVMGDNRNDSEDSAYHQVNHDTNPFVPIGDVTGQAILVSWPVNRWTFLGNYPLVFTAVPASSK
jgi:signal peptidase I